MVMEKRENPPQTLPQTLPKILPGRGPVNMERFETFAMRTAAYVLAGLSVCACATFGAVLAPGLEGLLYGAIFASLDVVKFALPGRAESSLRLGRVWKAIFCLLLFLPLAAMSMMSGLGLYKTMISQTSAPAKAEKQRYENALREEREIGAQLAKLPGDLPGVVTARIDKIKLDRRFERSKSCADATLVDSRELCGSFRELEGQLEIAKQVAELRLRLERAKTTVAGANLETIMMPVNPQADAIAATLAMVGVVIDKEMIPNGLAVVIVLLIEMSVLVFWLARDGVRKTEPRIPGSALSNEFEGHQIDAPTKGGVSPPLPASATALKSEEGPAEPDPFMIWLDTRTVRSSKRQATSEDLLAAYNGWARDNSYPKLSGAMLGRKLGEAGFVKRKVGGKMTYDGIGLKVERPALAVVR